MKSNIHTLVLMTLLLSILAGIGLTAGFFLFVGTSIKFWQLVG